MKVKFLTLLLFMLSIAQGFAQQCAGINISGGITVVLDTAKNVLVGPNTVWVVYNNAEFLLNKKDMTLRVTTIRDNGDFFEQKLDALISVVSDSIYRADVGDEWVQINAIDGTTCVYQHCVARVFKPYCR